MTHATPAASVPRRGGRAPLLPRGARGVPRGARHGLGRPAPAARRGPREARLLLDGAREAIAAVARRPHAGGGLHRRRHTAALHARGRGRSPRARRRAGTTVVVSAVERAAVLQRRGLRGATGDDRSPVDRPGGSTRERVRRASGVPGVALAALQHANGEVGTRAAGRGGARRRPRRRRPAAGGRRARASVTWPSPTPGTCSPRTRRDWGGPAGARRARGPAAGPAARPTGRRTRTGGSPGGVSVPAALAAAVALQVVESRPRGAGDAARRRARRRAARARRGRRPGRRGRRRPGRPAPPRRDVLVPLRGRRGARWRAGPRRVRGRLRLGVHRERAGAEPRAGGDGRAHARQRADRAGRSTDADESTASARCCPARWPGSASMLGVGGL